MTSVLFAGPDGRFAIDEGVIMDAVRAWFDGGPQPEADSMCMLPYGRARDGELYLRVEPEYEWSTTDDRPVPVNHIYTAISLDDRIIMVHRLWHYTTGEVMEWLQRETMLPMRLYDGNGVPHMVEYAEDNGYTYDDATGTFEPVERLDEDYFIRERLGWRYLWHGRIDRRMP